VWLSIPVAWLFFLGCGIALRTHDHEHDPVEPPALTVLR
jgi:hypothetical protein